MIHTLAYASFLEDPATWAILGIAAGLPATLARADMTRRRELLAGGALVVAAVLGWALVRTYPGYDSYFALLWGREIRHGFGPAYEVYAAPTPHPLWTAIGAVAGLFGRHGDRILILVTVISWAASVWGVARIGAALWDGARGLVAALFLATSSAFLLYAGKAFVDVPFVALVVWAGALEAERPRRGRSVALLLALAGLLRPEAWILALGYVAWLWWADRRIDPVVAALGVGAPLLWFLLDALATGDPLFSLHQTSFLVDSIGQDVPVWRVPDRLVSFLGSTVRPPILLLGGVGLVTVWLDRRRRALRELVVPLALLVGGIVAFVGSAVAVGTVQQRYLTLPAVAVCLFAAHALLGFRDRTGRFAPLAHGRDRRHRPRGARRRRAPARDRAPPDRRAALRARRARSADHVVGRARRARLPPDRPSHLQARARPALDRGRRPRRGARRAGRPGPASRRAAVRDRRGQAHAPLRDRRRRAVLDQRRAARHATRDRPDAVLPGQGRLPAVRVLALAPHPDDEVLGAGATLLGLSGAGWDVVVRACTLGSDPARHEQRAVEAREACRRLGWSWRAPDEPAWEDGPWDLVVSPHPEDDRHPAHAAAGREAAEQATGPWWRWALWGDLNAANRLVPFGRAELERLEDALGAHASELERLDLFTLLRARAELAAVRGPELVGAFGASRNDPAPFAELLDVVELR